MKRLNFDPQDPQELSSVETNWWKAHNERNKEALYEGLLSNVRKLYGLTKEDAHSIAMFMAKAAQSHDERNWHTSFIHMRGVYEIIKKSLEASFNPETAACYEIIWWKLHDELEDSMDKSELASVFAKLFSIVFELPVKDLSVAGCYRAKATGYHDLAEKPNISESTATLHWMAVEATLYYFYLLHNPE
jgi:hypothetical protein